MRVLVLGANGMLGHKLLERLSSRYEVWGTVRSEVTSSLPEEIYGRATMLAGILVESFSSLVRALKLSRPDVVINCIGIVKQKPEATDEHLSLMVNSLFPHVLADLCSLAGARLVHVSTDCVFSGSKGGYVESDEPDARDLYGRTKHLGEVHKANCLTLRTSIIGWQIGGSTGLLEWLAQNRSSRIHGFRQAVFSGVSTSAIADTIALILEAQPQAEGLYHVSADPIDKFTLLRRMVKALKWPTEVIPAEDPKINRSLDSTAFRAGFGWGPPSWEQMIIDLAEQRSTYERWRNR